MGSNRHHGLWPVITMLAGLFAGVVEALYALSSGGGDTTTIGLVLIALSIVVGATAGAALARRRGADAITAVAVGAAAALTTQILLTAVAWVGGRSAAGVARQLPVDADAAVRLRGFA